MLADSYSSEWPNVRLIWPRPRAWRLIEDFSVEWTAEGFPRQRLTALAGWEFDGASVPSAAEWFIGRELLLREAIPHDWIYAYRGEVPPESHLYLDEDGTWRPTYTTWSRRDADRLFARLLGANPFTQNAQRRAAFRAVRAFGRRAWQRERPRPTVLAAA